MLIRDGQRWHMGALPRGDMLSPTLSMQPLLSPAPTRTLVPVYPISPSAPIVPMVPLEPAPARFAPILSTAPSFAPVLPVAPAPLPVTLPVVQPKPVVVPYSAPVLAPRTPASEPTFPTFPTFTPTPAPTPMLLPKAAETSSQPLFLANTTFSPAVPYSAPAVMPTGQLLIGAAPSNPPPTSGGKIGTVAPGGGIVASVAPSASPVTRADTNTNPYGGGITVDGPAVLPDGSYVAAGESVKLGSAGNGAKWALLGLGAAAALWYFRKRR